MGENIGARLQADQAEADMRVARAKAEGRRAMAVAEEQEMIAPIEENRAKVVEAEAEVPKAIAQAFRDGTLGIMDYYKLRNVQADTDMRNAISKIGVTPTTRNEERGMNAARCRWRRPTFGQIVGIVAVIVVSPGAGVGSMSARQHAAAAGRLPRRAAAGPRHVTCRRDRRVSPPRFRAVAAAGQAAAAAAPPAGNAASRPNSSRSRLTSRSATEVGKQVEKYLDTGEFSRARRNLAARWSQADAQVNRRLKQVFDHDVSQLAKKPGERPFATGQR